MDWYICYATDGSSIVPILRHAEEYINIIFVIFFGVILPKDTFTFMHVQGLLDKGICE